MSQLPQYQIGGKLYYRDARLGEYRNVTNPSDRKRVEDVPNALLEKPTLFLNKDGNVIKIVKRLFVILRSDGIMEVVPITNSEIDYEIRVRSNDSAWQPSTESEVLNGWFGDDDSNWQEIHVNDERNLTAAIKLLETLTLKSTPSTAART